MKDPIIEFTPGERYAMLRARGGGCFVAHEAALTELLQAGLIEQTEHGIRLTAEGRFVAGYARWMALPE